MTAPDDQAQLFAIHPATSLTELIVFDPDMDERAVAASYEEAATRLADSFTGKPVDDLILMPLLFLWRQSIELTLKATIRDLSSLRRGQGENADELQPHKVDARLRNPKKVGHNLTKLTEELVTHLEALDAEVVPVDVLETLSFLAESDERGTGFRYAGEMASGPANVDLRNLNRTLRRAALMLTVTIDAVTNGEGVSVYLASKSGDG